MLFRPRFYRPHSWIVASLCILSLLESFLFAHDRWVLLYLFIGNAALCTAVGGLLSARHARERGEVSNFIEQLCRIDTKELCDPNVAEKLPPCWVGEPWQVVFGRLQDRIIEYSQLLAEAEHSRASAEVRARRTTTVKEQFAEILMGLPDPVLAIDEYDELAMANTAARQLLGISMEGCRHGTVQQLVRNDALVELLTSTKRRKRPAHRTSDIQLVGHDGLKRWFRVSCRSLHVPGDQGVSAAGGAVALLRDISSQRATQKRNAEFVSAVSHEMKTPLSGIKAYVELLLDGDAEDEETRDEFLNVINSQADRLQRLIDNLLNLARIEAGVVAVNKQPQSLNELLEEALGVVQPTAEQQQIALVADLSPLYLGVLADRDMLLQAAINLLSNAIKYTGPQGKVMLRSRLLDNEVVFEVEDNGVGISPKDCERVFDKFYRVKKDQQMAPGTGLGLALAKHIVEDVHGGRLGVRSQLGKGSIFCISLPNEARLTS